MYQLWRTVPVNIVLRSREDLGCRMRGCPQRSNQIRRVPVGHLCGEVVGRVWGAFAVVDECKDVQGARGTDNVDGHASVALGRRD